MTERNLNPQYVLDKAGKKAFVVLPVDQYESLLEDIQTSGIPTAIRPGGLSATVFPNKKGHGDSVQRYSLSKTAYVH